MLERMLQRFPIVSRIFLSALMTVGLLGLAEWSLSDGEWSQLYDGDPGVLWWLKSDLDLSDVPHVEEGTTFSVQTNAIGMRDGMMPVASPWVLALGCSTTFGWGVEADETWPAVLEQELGVPVVNGGIPGHSTEQALAIAPKLMAHTPDVVIFGWGLRDAQRTTVADADRRTATFPRNTALYKTLRRKLQSPVVSRGTIPRVSAEQFEANLRQLIAMAEAAGAEVLLLDMTERSDHPDHGRVLGRLERPVVVPKLPSSMVFDADPIHLNVQGNEALARLLAPGVSALLAQEEDDSLDP